MPRNCSILAAAEGRKWFSASYPTISETRMRFIGPMYPVWWASESCHLHALEAKGEMQSWVIGRLSDPWRALSFAKINVSRCVMSHLATIESVPTKASSTLRTFFNKGLKFVAWCSSGFCTCPTLHGPRLMTLSKTDKHSIMYWVLLGQIVASTDASTYLAATSVGGSFNLDKGWWTWLTQHHCVQVECWETLTNYPWIQSIPIDCKLVLFLLRPETQSSQKPQNDLLCTVWNRSTRCSTSSYQHHLAWQHERTSCNSSPSTRPHRHAPASGSAHWRNEIIMTRQDVMEKG